MVEIKVYRSQIFIVTTTTTKQNVYSSSGHEIVEEPLDDRGWCRLGDT